MHNEQFMVLTCTALTQVNKYDIKDEKITHLASSLHRQNAFELSSLQFRSQFQ